MTSLFVTVLRQAFKTFDCSNQCNFAANLQQLKLLTDQLTYRDLQLNHEELFQEPATERPGRAAPCKYMHIFENDIVSLSIFVLRNGYTMPLHDHPKMHGILRGIYGQLCVQSYTLRLASRDYDNDPQISADLPVVREEPCLVSPDTECAMLTPQERNFHEITAINGVAAFFDILSPPYQGRRRCQFYRPKMQQPLSPTMSLKTPPPTLLLQCIPSPMSYYCDVAETPEAIMQCTYLCAAEEGQTKELE